MARRTKEEALATRHALLDAAERVFHTQGVADTSLGDIAAAAGTTRGAIYWHFKDKADLYNAMMERVSLPLELAFRDIVQLEPSVDPLPGLRRALDRVLERTVHDPRTRRVFEVATHKVEYGDALNPVRERHLAVRQDFLVLLQRVLAHAARVRGVRLARIPDVALGLHTLLDGLIQNWLLDANAFDLQRVGRRSIDTYLRGLGFGPAGRTPAGSRGEG